VLVLKLRLLVVLQQKVGELILSTTYSHSNIILENTLNSCIEKCGYGNLTTGIMFLLFTFGRGKFYAHNVVRDCLKFEGHWFSEVCT
jgi:hypothetical protein